MKDRVSLKERVRLQESFVGAVVFGSMVSCITLAITLSCLQPSEDGMSPKENMIEAGELEAQDFPDAGKQKYNDVNEFLKRQKASEQLDRPQYDLEVPLTLDRLQP